MRAFHRRKAESVGQSPGLLVYVGQDRDFHPTLTSLSFTSGEVTETCCELPEAPPPPEKPPAFPGADPAPCSG